MRLCRGALAVLLLLWFAGIADLRAAEDRSIGFDCVKDRSPLAVAVCNDQTAAAAERRATISYLAAYFELSEDRRPTFRSDHMLWLNGLTIGCIPPSNARSSEGQTALSLECVRRSYTQRGELYRKKLNGAALEEANLSPTLLKKIQTRLVELKFLSGTPDGMFGAETRAAVKKYQVSIGHEQTNFLTAQERNTLLQPTATAEQASRSENTWTTSTSPSAVTMPIMALPGISEPSSSKPLPGLAAPNPSAPPVAVSGPPSEQTKQDNAAPRSEPRLAEQQSASNDLNPPGAVKAAAQPEERSVPQTDYFFAGALLACVILAVAAFLVFSTLRRPREKLTAGSVRLD